VIKVLNICLHTLLCGTGGLLWLYNMILPVNRRKASADLSIYRTLVLCFYAVLAGVTKWLV